MTTKLENAYVIGASNFQNWSQGFDASGYLKVLPHPDQKVTFKDPFADWQAGRPGNYYSSWGPSQELNITLTLQDLSQVNIDGFGILKAGDGKIPWFNNEATPYERLRSYNGTIPGPMIITEPGDTINIKLQNNLKNPNPDGEPYHDVTNLHTHGLHVSPVGHGDNVVIAVNPGETWDTSIKIPDNHFIGMDWYHPHLHGVTNEQVSSGLAGSLLIAPPYDLPDLQKWNPKERPMHFLAINTFGVQEIDRPGNANDPLNQDPTKVVPAGTPLKVVGTENGENIYERSDAPYMGYNAKPIPYDPKQPTGNPPNLFEYGGGPLAEPVENVIHTVNGQYNPTMDLKTGEWNLFTFTNMDSNAFHVIQLVRDDGQTLTLEPMTLVAIDGDSSGVVADTRREVTELPVLSSGQRLSFQYWFDQPGTYYFLSNGTDEIMGDNTSYLIRGKKGFSDGHLIWGPQVLATVQVTGPAVPRGAFPEVYTSLEAQSREIQERIEAAASGQSDRKRTFTWSANIGDAIIPPPSKPPTDTEVGTFQGTYRINGDYFSETFGESMVPLAMPMIGSTEIWTIENASGKSTTTAGVPNVPLPEWHPFHIHQNDFTVLEVNGTPVDQLTNGYLGGVLQDTVALSPTYAPGTATPDNPFGTPIVNGQISEVKTLMKFEDFPGTYVNHCHILFHEDAGMMAPVRVILNTKDTWIGLGSEAKANGVELHRANNLLQNVTLTPYGQAYKGSVDVAIADVNYTQQTTNNQNVTDNVTDVITVQSAPDSSKGGFTVKVFDGKKLIDLQDKGSQTIDGSDDLLIAQFTAFNNVKGSANTKASVAAGDINGDGFADIVVGVGGETKPSIEVYSGKDRQLLTRIDPFQSETNFTGIINVAVGDANGDNFEDIIVGQGAGGRGLVEVYSGKSIDEKGNLNGQETAKNTALLTETFQPYGASYNGEVEVTSGYVLQRPDAPNGQAVQTYRANITTLAVGNVPSDRQAVQVFTYYGGAGHGEMDSGQMAEVRLDASFTPTNKLSEISGTYADISGLSRGEPVLFGLTDAGQPQVYRLQEKNIAQAIDLSAGVTMQTNSDDLIYGDTGDNSLMGAIGNDSLYGGGENDQVNGNQGNDMVAGGQSNDTVRGGRDNDLVFGNQGQDICYGDNGDDTVRGGQDDDEVFGNQGQDVLYGDLGNDLLRGGKDNDLIYGNQGQDLIYGDLGNDSLYGGKENDTLIGGGGDDLLSGDMGNDMLIGEDGSDRFVLASGMGFDNILDFSVGQDVLVLANGLTFAQLSITQGSSGALISITSTGEQLALLNAVQANLIGASSFA